jgi:hypothetical protein
VSRIPRRRVRHAVITLTVLAAACGRKDSRPGADSSAASRSPAPATTVRLAAPVGAGPVFPGALTKPIDSYTGDELYALTTRLAYAGSHERDRECRNASGCGGPNPTKKTKVQVSAVATQDSLVESNVPQFGVVYTRAINKGAEEEARYGMRAGRTFRYYMIVQRDSAGGMRWRLEELATSTPRRHTQIGSGKFQPCAGHAWKPGARADFKTCEAPERGDTVVTMGLVLQGSDRDPIWVGCGPGCCIFGG